MRVEWSRKCIWQTIPPLVSLLIRMKHSYTTALQNSGWGVNAPIQVAQSLTILCMWLCTPPTVFYMVSALSNCGSRLSVWYSHHIWSPLNEWNNFHQSWEPCIGFENPPVTIINHHQHRFDVNIWVVIMLDHLFKVYLLPNILQGGTCVSSGSSTNSPGECFIACTAEHVVSTWWCLSTFW